MSTHTNGVHEAETTGADLRVPVRLFVEFDGWPMHVDLLIAPARVGKAIDRLQSLGFTPQKPAQSATVASAQATPVGVSNANDRPEPYIDGDGDYACPIHRKKLKQGNYQSWYCSAKAKPDEPQNAKGYCSCSIKE